MNPITPKSFALNTLLAAAFGSGLGSIFSITYSVLGLGHYSSTPNPTFAVLMFPIMLVVSFIGTVPGAFLIALPLYPFRHAIAARPLLWSLPLALLGLGVGTLILGWASRQEYEYPELFLPFSAATGLGFAVSLGWRTGRLRSR